MKMRKVVAKAIAKSMLIPMLAVSLLIPSAVVYTSPMQVSAVETIEVTGYLQEIVGTVITFKTDAGTMLIKLDTTTDLSGCTGLVANAPLSIAVYRGDDAYMHANRIVTTTAAAVGTASSGDQSAQAAPAATSPYASMSAAQVQEAALAAAQEAANKAAAEGADAAGIQAAAQAAVERVASEYAQAVQAAEEAKKNAQKAAQENNNASSGSTVTTSDGVTVDTGNPVTVTGKVDEGSTSSLINLTTSDGQMKVKIDSNTDLSKSLGMAVGSRVTATVGYGSDAYMHAIRIVSGEVKSGGSYATAKGTLVDGSWKEVIKLRADGKTTTYYVDDTTDMSQAPLLLPNRIVTISYYEGTDGKRHAASVKDEGESASSKSSSKSSSDSSSKTRSDTVIVTGKIGDNSRSNLIYLKIDGNDEMMQIKPDSNCDMSRSKILIPGNTVKAEIYRNDDDGYMHAVAFTAEYRLDGDANVDKNEPMTVTGKVSSGSNANIINLNIDGEIMKIRLDSTTDYSKCRVIKSDKTIRVSIGYGDDAYMHAISISE